MPSGSRLALLALCTLLAVGAVAVQPTVGSPVAGDASHLTMDRPEQAIDSPGAPAVATEVPASNTTMRIDLSADGDARWHVTTAFNLTDDADREAFRRLAGAFQDGDADAGWLPAFREARARASDATGRTMEISSIDRSWQPPVNESGPGTGRLTLSFTWTNFVAVEDDGGRLAVGDVFVEPDPPLLTELRAGEILVVEPPAEYTPVTGTGDLRDGAFYWEGPVTFGEEPPSAVFTGGPSGSSTLLVAALVVGGLVVLLALVYLVARRRTTVGDGDSGDSRAAAGDAPAEPTTGDAEPAADSGESETASDSAAAPEAAEASTDTALLSDEERVERLLEANGGRMKQATIVKETGWSNAKVSQLLSAMAEEGRIDKLRIGRENLISFPDEDVTDVED